MRLGCDHCNDTYDEDNLMECARCDASTCWKCAIHARLPKLAKGTWWCDRCLKDVGRTDLLKGQRYFPPTEEERQLAVARILTAGGYTLAGELAWKRDRGENLRLLAALKTMGMNVDHDCRDFEKAPSRMSSKTGSLVLTESGYDKLRSAVLSALS